MNITAYYPAIFVNDLDAASEKYENMGFERRHTLDYGYFKLHVMKLHEYRLDLFTSDLEEYRMEEGAFAMRINVDDFYEGIETCKELGYQVILGPTQEPSFQLAILADDNGHRVFLFHHIKTSFAFSD